MEWERLTSRLQQIQSDVDPFRIPTEDELELLELSYLTYGVVESPLIDEHAYGHAIIWRLSGEPVVGKVIRHGLHRAQDKLDVARAIAVRFGFISIGENDPLITRVSRLLRGRTVSSEFIETWGELNYYHGMYMALFAFVDPEDQLVKSSIQGLVKTSTKIQKHWYAHWVKRRTDKLTPKARSKADEELVSLINQLKSGAKKLGRRYPLEWYTIMLSKKDPKILNRTLIDLTASEIHDLLAHPTLTPDVLPPLAATEFS